MLELILRGGAAVGELVLGLVLDRRALRERGRRAAERGETGERGDAAERPERGDTADEPRDQERPTAS
ncbi:hypothetical protein [Agromyces sp. Leaf222]|uniref:hypothetical protein n=1 Tax=Agromyces sp. Leaf222 TaxID=1735688 RepID=UPI0006F2021A|nr:hypothetical protein [Agromyces sp. Leaf222]KQM81462.1 hypothetical protein ASE68_17050 [Agromyces sp. Leaf222]